ncbi:PEP-CTERM/exosortase system-associated acyltransferase [Halomonas sp. MCCC 1A11036]|uniref:PEP-CTERM/exosortase system-associated acyltransferase n=1 Tax=Billgrantia zhangzhouensis TaxID=2733481 RepID=A0ABS9AH37_9GAMM|nr:PEP-CTERM/exosortase system-associated acyltransferase [Halomonas zhangzhouensis]MCE8021006.1 PEP-CTERM/exosortase system-associated acyltransferase [Halomonas zhangzhouensis]
METPHPKSNPSERGMPQGDRVREFLEQYRFVIARSRESRYRAYALRHKVFREELRYALGEDTGTPFEKDAHDKHSILCLLHHTGSDRDAGCLRVVLPIGNDGQPRSLPLEESCAHGLTDPQLHPDRFEHSSLCEVSRLAVHPDFRRTRDCALGLRENDLQLLEENRLLPPSPLVTLSLFLAATAIVGLAGRRHVFAMMEPRFARLLKISGLEFRRVGDVIDYCGPRAAYYIDQHQAERGLQSSLRPLYRHIKTSLAPQMLGAAHT